MPKVKHAIPTDVLLRELDKFASDILITPDQAGMVLARTTGQLADDRSAGNPPPFVKVGGSNRYRIGDVRDYIRTRTFRNTEEASIFERERIAGMGFSSFLDFLDHGEPGNNWPFSIIGGKPIDFFASLTLQLSDDDHCEWLTLEQYLNRRRDWGKSCEAGRERNELSEFFDTLPQPSLKAPDRGPL